MPLDSYIFIIFFLTQAYDKQVKEALHSDERRIIVAQKDIRLASIRKKRLLSLREQICCCVSCSKHTNYYIILKNEA